MRGRRLAAAVLVVLTCVLTLGSALALWLRSLVLDTDAYVHAVTPVLDHEEVRAALAETVVAALYDHVDVAAELRSALPDRAQQLAPTLAAAIRSTSVQLAASALGTPAARRAWQDANRIAHDQLVRVLEGRGGIVTTARGEVAIDTTALTAAVLRTLDEHDVHVFDSVPLDRVDGRFVLFRSTDLLRAQQATRVLDELATWLPVATFVAGAAALGCATQRRRMLQVLALGVAGVMALVVTGASVGRAYYLDHVGASYRTIAAAPFDALVAPLRTGARWTFAAAVAVAAAAWLTASQTVVAHERRVRTRAVAVLQRDARAFAVGGAAVAAVVLVAWDRPRPVAVLATVGALTVWELACLAAARGRTGAGTATAARRD